MLSYTLGYSTPLLAVGATGGQALANLRKARDDDDGGGGFNLSATLGQWVNPLTGGVLIAFGMNGLLVALLGDPSVSALAPIID
jgi:cytochrome c biogenesis protein CcdA